MPENIKYGSYPINDDFNDLPIEYEHMFFTKQPIDCLTNNIIERLKVSFIKISVDTRTHKSDPQNYDFDDLPFDGNERLIAEQQIYRINDDIVFRSKNGSSVYVKKN